jgi:XTP/dITP diphosphohydrolase
VILVGSKNPNKLREIRQVLEPLGLRAVIPVQLPEVEETGADFAANAALKARAYAEFLGGPCLSDDSGLVVPALDGEPGVRSSRYAGVEGDRAQKDRANLELLLRRIRERGLGEPEAFFRCSLALAVPGELLLEVEGRVAGRIVSEPRGENGFGYDPVFFHPPSGCTFAQLAAEAKNAVSHRARALAELVRRLPEVRDRIES